MLSRRIGKWVGGWCACFVIAALGAARSDAAPIRVVTFTGLPESTPVWIEDGVTVIGDVVGSDEMGDAAHVDACCTSYASILSFTTGSVFQPISLAIDPIESGYCQDPDGACGGDDPVPYIRISGFANDVLLASGSFHLPGSDDFVTVSLVDLLGPIQIDDLHVQAISFDDSEGHFNVDDVTLELVPEPSTAALVAGGLLGMALRRRSRGLRAAL